MERHLYVKSFYFQSRWTEDRSSSVSGESSPEATLALMFTLSHKLTLLQLILNLLKPNTLERYLDYDVMICTKADFLTIPSLRSVLVAGRLLFLLATNSHPRKEKYTGRHVTRNTVSTKTELRNIPNVKCKHFQSATGLRGRGSSTDEPRTQPIVLISPSCSMK